MRSQRRHNGLNLYFMVYMAYTPMLSICRIYCGEKECGWVGHFRPAVPGCVVDSCKGANPGSRERMKGPLQYRHLPLGNVSLYLHSSLKTIVHQTELPLSYKRKNLLIQKDITFSLFPPEITWKLCPQSHLFLFLNVLTSLSIHDRNSFEVQCSVT